MNRTDHQHTRPTTGVRPSAVSAGAATGRGTVPYRRCDGRCGLITPVL